MQVLVKTDNAMKGGDGLHRHVEDTVAETLGRFGKQVISVHVHLSDSNSHKKGDDDKRCTMEARLAGINPIAVTNDAGSVDAAIDGATKKLGKAIDHALDRIGGHKGHAPASGGEMEE